MANVPNSPNFNTTPQNLFGLPGPQSGISLITPLKGAAGDLYRDIENTRIFGSGLSIHPNVKRAENAVVDSYIYRERFAKLIEFNTVPIVVKNLSVRHSYRYVGKKFLPNGASNVRFTNRYLWHHSKSEPKNIVRALAHKIEDTFEAAQPQYDDFAATQQDLEGVKDLPIVIDCKNFRNYYHFLTEAFCHLSLVDKWGLTGPIYFVSPMKASDRRAFCDLLVQDFFPHLVDRVSFKKSPMFFEKALTYYSFREGLGATPFAQNFRPQFHPDVQDDWKYISRTTGSIVRQNCCDASQRRLRQAALQQVEKAAHVQTPKRIWVSRRADENARDRTMENEDFLISLLKPLGFEVVYFEDHSPLTQAKLVNNAQIVASYHGAGLANMMFADPSTTVIEMGNLHSATYRWEEFKQHAAVSGCRYVSFFGDLKGFSAEDTLEAVRVNRAMGNIPVKLEKPTCALILEYIKFLCASYDDTAMPFDFKSVTEILVSMRDWEMLETLATLSDLPQDNAWSTHTARAAKVRAAGDVSTALEALEKAIAIRPGYWALLELAIDIAKQSSDPKIHSDLVARYEKRYPDRSAQQLKGPAPAGSKPRKLIISAQKSFEAQNKGTNMSDIARWEHLYSLSPENGLVAVADIGANPINPAPYQALLNAGLCTVYGFEPNEDAYNKLVENASDNEVYVNSAVGPYGKRKLYLYPASGFSSLYPLDPKALAFLGKFQNQIGNETVVDIELSPLDAVPDLPEIDLLKIDVQGAELEIIQSGRAKLSNACAMIVEARFFPIYLGEPTWRELDAELDFMGFAMHKFLEVAEFAMGNTLEAPARMPLMRNQMLDGDVVYIPNRNKFAKMSDHALIKSAVIADAVYGSFDVALKCLDALKGRNSITSSQVDAYCSLLPAGLQRQKSNG